MRWFTLLLIGCVSIQASAADINVPGVHGPTIQAAIVAANPGDVVIVAPGTYPESINFLGKAITVRSTDPNDIGVVLNTIIDGTGFDHVVLCVSGEGLGTVLSGFVITGGFANGGGNDNWGGGMINFNSSPTVTNCSFTGNTAQFAGGMYNANGSRPTLTNCLFSGNTAGFGGGMYNNASNATLTNCSFIGNKATAGSGIGGGMINSTSRPTLTNCSFNGNTAVDGGGMFNTNSSNATLINCSFNGNSATQSGGGMANFLGSSPTVTDCTFSGNSAVGSGGGMKNDFGTSPTVTNTGFCNNTPDTINGPYTDGGGNYSMLFCPPPIPDPCPADTDGSGDVNVTDLLDLLAAWGACP